MILRRLLSITLTVSLAVMALGVAAVAQDATDIERRPVEDQLFGVKSVIPADWQDLGSGIYSRGTPPDDLALIAIQSAAATPEQLWPSLLPQFALTETPEVGGTYSTELFDWTLYPFAVELADTVISAEVALAEDDGSTHLVLLQSDPAEFDILRERVLLPALDAFDVAVPEPTPDPSTFDYQIEEVAFPGGSIEVELAGTLTLPSGDGPHPAVVLMTGSGAQDRDESLRPITTLKPFAVIADALTSAGVGVLRYDDRGVGGSTGDYDVATVEELASDARAAIDYLESREDIDPDRIGVFGHSEGGLYAAMLGASDPRVAYIGTMAPAVVDGVSLIVEQQEAILRASGASEEQVTTTVDWAAEIMPLARDGDFEGAEELSREYFGRLWDELTPDEQVIAGDRDTFIGLQIDTQVPIITSDWYRSFLAYDPTQDWEQVKVPVLGIFGGKDVQVTAQQNEPALRAALEAAGNEDVETITFPEANHLFQAADTGAFAEYAVLEPEFVDGFVDAIVDWMTVRAGATE